MKAEGAENLALETEDRKEFLPGEKLEKQFDQKDGQRTFAKTLRSARELHGGEKKFSEMAEFLSLTASKIKALECGREIPTMKLASKIAKALDCCEKTFMELAVNDSLRLYDLDFKAEVFSLEELAERLAKKLKGLCEDDLWPAAELEAELEEEFGPHTLGDSLSATRWCDNMSSTQFAKLLGVSEERP